MAEVQITEEAEIGLAWIGARRGIAESQLRAAASEDSFAEAWLAIGPDTWLARRRGTAGSDWCKELSEKLAGLAGVTDQTGAYRAFRFDGANARTLLQRGAAVDFDPPVFPRGAVASTVIAHIDVIVVCVEPGSIYDVFVYRSFAESFRRWIDHALAGLMA